MRPSRKAFAIVALVCACFLLGGCVERAFAGPNRTGSPRAGSELAPHSFARAYLVRGILGLIFSRGMNCLAERLGEAGVDAEVYDFPTVRRDCRYRDQGIRRSACADRADRTFDGRAMRVADGKTIAGG